MSPFTHRSGKGFRGGFLLNLFEVYLKSDMQRYLTLMRKMYLLPTYFGAADVTGFLGQRFHGNVTLRPPSFRLSDYLSLMSDAGEKRMREYFSGGKQMVFPHIVRIRQRMLIESVLDHYMYLLKSQ